MKQVETRSYTAYKNFYQSLGMVYATYNQWAAIWAKA